ncbi:hypothetical protein BDY21DRAFT_391409 [Lineolata rhizophorae]|uniref:Uncharacterized protein n=1 Tax=Lineolata rhizophorae TaxID=578093 RepID=A0A6A6P0D9_9PEZI|nr:hypothetical protein BDY21DRAFT_391409 [Lineolata rhizophorae]
MAEARAGQWRPVLRPGCLQLCDRASRAKAPRPARSRELAPAARRPGTAAAAPVWARRPQERERVTHLARARDDSTATATTGAGGSRTRASLCVLSPRAQSRVRRAHPLPPPLLQALVLQWPAPGEDHHPPSPPSAGLADKQPRSSRARSSRRHPLMRHDPTADRPGLRAPAGPCNAIA